jgi:hypothetical protein
MPIPYIRFVFKDLAVEPDGISVSDAETKDVPINLGEGGIINVKLKKKQVEFTFKGPVGSRFDEFETERYNNTLSAINGQLTGEDITLFGQTITNAYLDDVTQSGAININGRIVFNELKLTYISLDYV